MTKKSQKVEISVRFSENSSPVLTLDVLGSEMNGLLVPRPPRILSLNARDSGTARGQIFKMALMYVMCI